MPPPPPSGVPGFGAPAPAPAPAAVGYAPPGGPALGPHTRVMGRRIIAYIVDALIASAIAAVVFFAVADTATLPPGFGDVCELVEGGLCVQAGDRVWLAEGGNAAAVFLAGFGYFVLVHMLIQGMVGWTPGKLLVGLRVVSAQTGQLAGIGRCVIRSLLLIVDGTFFIGFIVALVTPNRQRIGDLAAKTLVVPRRVVGMAGTAPAPTGFAAQPFATAASTSFQQPVSYSQPVAPAQQPLAAPAQPVNDHPSTSAVAGQATVETTTSASAASPGEPQWDAARNAWILWDASRNSWMIHDTATGQWRPM